MDIDGRLWIIGRYIEQVFSSRSHNNIGIAAIDAVVNW